VARELAGSANTLAGPTRATLYKVFEMRPSAAARSLASGAAAIGARFRASSASLKSGLRPKLWLTPSE